MEQDIAKLDIFLTKEEFREIINVKSDPTIRRVLKRGLPYILVGKRIYISLQELLRWLEEQKK